MWSVDTLKAWRRGWCICIIFPKCEVLFLFFSSFHSPRVLSLLSCPVQWWNSRLPCPPRSAHTRLAQVFSVCCHTISETFFLSTLVPGCSSHTAHTCSPFRPLCCSPSVWEPPKVFLNGVSKYKRHPVRRGLCFSILNLTLLQGQLNYYLTLVYELFH